ncbi:MAG: TraM recognition domain-containing protein, partial [bacterium]|nr:TraM recognition domain-containing protein [bacterium]
IIAQPKSAFNFRESMNDRKILLVNLAKGRLGDLNSELLGLIVVGKFLQAALSRVDQARSADLPPFYLYIDEFQNFTTPSIATILSEARKYKLSLNIAHQFIAQLDEKIRDAVFGNVGTKCVFRVGIEDAEFLEKQFQPDFNAKDIVGLDNYNAYLSLLGNGKPVRPFNMVTLPPDERANFTQVEDLKQFSFNTYGRDREEVEAEIAERYAKKPEEEVPGTGPFGSVPRF